MADVSARAEAVARICGRTGKTPEQAEAFLDILGSALTRRSWVDSVLLDEREIGTRLSVFLGGEPINPSCEHVWDEVVPPRDRYDTTIHRCRKCGRRSET